VPQAGGAARRRLQLPISVVEHASAAQRRAGAFEPGKPGWGEV
jgi:hypothetical protein